MSTTSAKPVDDLIKRLLTNLKQTGTAYIYIYLVENRLRAFANDILQNRYEDQYRDGWLHEVLSHVDKGLTDTLETRRISHLAKNGYLSIDDHPIFAFLSLGELKVLVLRHWDVFKIHFRDKVQFNAVFDVIEVARNSAAHNRAVSVDLVKDLREQCLCLIEMMGGLGYLDTSLHGLVELDIVEELFAARYLDVVGVFANRSDFQSKISYEEYFRTARHIDAVGLSLNAVTLNYGSDSLLKLVRDREAEVRLLFLAPFGKAIKEREIEEGYDAGALSGLTATNIHVVEKACEALPVEMRQRLQFRVYDSSIRLNLYIIDQTIAVAQHYSPAGAGVESPCLLIKNKQGDAGLFNHYRSIFENMWIQSQSTVQSPAVQPDSEASTSNSKEKGKKHRKKH